MSKAKLASRTLAVLLALVMMVGVWGTYIPAQASGTITVYMTVEAYNANRGWIVQPTRLNVPDGTSVAEATETLLTQMNVSFSVDPSWGWYLERVGGLREFDDSPTSGWMFTVNHALLDVGADSFSLSSGDVIRLQFTVRPGDLGLPTFGYLGVCCRGSGYDYSDCTVDGWGCAGWGPVPALYTHADKTELIRALFGSGVTTSGRRNALSVLINPRATTSQVGNALNGLTAGDITDSDRTVSGGGGGGGSAAGTVAAGTGTAAAIPATQAAATVSVTQAAATTAVSTALAQASASGANVATVSLQNPGEISLSTLQAMVSSASNTPLRVNADSLLPSGSVDVRISFNPALATGNINLAASTVSPNAQSTRSLFERHFGGTISVVSLSQQSTFGMDVRIAARIDPALNTDALVFLAYNRENNTFTRFTPSFVWMDSNGFLHFNTGIGGDIVITNTQI